MTSQSVISLGAGIEQIYSIQLAKKNGFRVIALDSDPNAIGFEFSDLSFTLDLFDKDEIIATLETLAFSFVLLPLSVVC